MYGIERVEGSIEERAAEYVPKLLELHNGSVHAGGLVPGRCAGLRLRHRAQAVPAPTCSSSDSIDLRAPGEPIDQSKAGMRARWDRYARFAAAHLQRRDPRDPLRGTGEARRRGPGAATCSTLVAQSGVQIPGGIIEHQRTSYLDQRALDTIEIRPYDGHVTLYMADRVPR